MKLFGFNRAYANEFDPYFVYAEDLEEAIRKIRIPYPDTKFNIYLLKEIQYPGTTGKDYKGVYSLEFSGIC